MKIAWKSLFPLWSHLACSCVKSKRQIKVTRKRRCNEQKLMASKSTHSMVDFCAAFQICFLAGLCFVCLAIFLLCAARKKIGKPIFTVIDYCQQRLYFSVLNTYICLTVKQWRCCVKKRKALLTSALRSIYESLT